MKKQRAIEGLTIGLLIALFCFPSAVFAKAEESFEKRLDLVKDGKVYLKNISGDITVKGWSKNEVLVKARKMARRKADLDNVSIDISRTNGTVRIITKYTSGGWSRLSNVSVYYELFVPEKASVEVETISGNVEPPPSTVSFPAPVSMATRPSRGSMISYRVVSGSRPSSFQARPTVSVVAVFDEILRT